MKMNLTELKKILDAHQLWLNNDGGEQADLSRANLSEARLSGANLYGADLYGASGNLAELKSIFIETYPITYTEDVLQIGCERHTITDWWAFDDERINNMDSKALAWWKKWQPILKQIISESAAVVTETIRNKCN